jgi:hypothetical protein
MGSVSTEHPQDPPLFPAQRAAHRLAELPHELSEVAAGAFVVRLGKNEVMTE